MMDDAENEQTCASENRSKWQTAEMSSLCCFKVARQLDCPLQGQKSKNKKKTDNKAKKIRRQ